MKFYVIKLPDSTTPEEFCKDSKPQEMVAALRYARPVDQLTVKAGRLCTCNGKALNKDVHLYAEEAK